MLPFAIYNMDLQHTVHPDCFVNSNTFDVVLSLKPKH